MYFLYIIQSQKSGNFYVGITTDFNRRLAEHNNPKKKKNSFTSKHRPWELVALFQCPSLEMAVKCEQYIKQQKNTRLIEHLCEEGSGDKPLPLTLQKMKKVFLKGVS